MSVSDLLQSHSDCPDRGCELRRHYGKWQVKNVVSLCAAGITPSSESHFWARATPLSHGHARGVGGCQAQTDGASCILCRATLRWLVGMIFPTACPPSWSRNQWKRQTFSFVYLWWAYWPTVGVNYCWETLIPYILCWKWDFSTTWAARDDWMVSKVNNAIASLTESLCMTMAQPSSSWRRAKTTFDVVMVVWSLAPVSLPCCFLIQGFSWRLLCSCFCTASWQKGMLQIDKYMLVHESNACASNW